MAKSSTPNIAALPPDVRRAFEYHDQVHNNIAQQVNAEPVGHTPAPPPLAGLKVTGGAGILHATISDPANGYRGLGYHMEVVPTGGNFDTDGHPIHLGPARAYRGTLGPAIYDVRACHGYDTSNPSPWIYAKGIDTTGPNPPAFHASTGSGTGGGAWGNAPYDGNTPPKRA